MEGPFHGVIQPPANQQIRTFRIPPDAREIGAVADRSQPGEQLAQVSIRPQETGYQDHAFAMAVRHAQPIEDRCQPELNQFEADQEFLPHGNIGFLTLVDGVPLTRHASLSVADSGLVLSALIAFIGGHRMLLNACPCVINPVPRPHPLSPKAYTL